MFSESRGIGAARNSGAEILKSLLAASWSPEAIRAGGPTPLRAAGSNHVLLGASTDLRPPHRLTHFSRRKMKCHGRFARIHCVRQSLVASDATHK